MMRSTKGTLLLLAACWGCAADTRDAHSAAATTADGRGDAGGALDACAILRKADIDAVFAPRVFGEGEKGAHDVIGTDRLTSVSTCRFTSAGPSARERMTVSILLRRAPSDAMGVTPAAAREGALKLHASPVDVSGLGDGAYWVNLGGTTRPLFELNVFQGRRLWLIVGATTSKLDSGTALAGLTRLAAVSLGRL